MSDTPPRAAAFFDVDETLINARSMYGFLEFYLAAARRPATAFGRLRDEFTALARSGMPREDINRLFFRPFAGEPAAAVRAAGQAWFDRESRTPGFYHLATVGALALHRSAGHAAVLVSGTFPACAAPVGRAVGADAVLCAVPDEVDGYYTGALDQPMIGTAKAAAAGAFADARGLRLADCWAYGDHVSDLDLLEAVGHPVVVGDDPVLLGRARERGWRVLAHSGGFTAPPAPDRPARRRPGTAPATGR